MSSLQIIGGPQSNFVWVTRIVAAEKNIDYELIAVMPHTAHAAGVHPLGKIPGLRHNDLLLGESRAICSYLDRMFSDYHLYHAARADLLRRLGNPAAARDAYLRPFDLATNASERAFIQARLRALGE